MQKSVGKFRVHRKRAPEKISGSFYNKYDMNLNEKTFNSVIDVVGIEIEKEDSFLVRRLGLNLYFGIDFENPIAYNLIQQIIYLSPIRAMLSLKNDIPIYKMFDDANGYSICLESYYLLFEIICFSTIIHFINTTSIRNCTYNKDNSVKLVFSDDSRKFTILVQSLKDNMKKVSMTYGREDKIKFVSVTPYHVSATNVIINNIKDKLKFYF